MGFPDNDTLSIVKKVSRDLYIGVGEDIYNSCYLKGQFKLRSGQTSDEYFDKYRFECSPALLSLVCNQLHYLIKREQLQFDIIAGMEMGGIPIATLLAHKENENSLPEYPLNTYELAFIRKKAKDYGTYQIIEGAPVDGMTCLVVEDVVTTGGQIIGSIRKMREEGAIVNDVICVLDREYGAARALSDEDIRLHALYTMSQLREYADMER